MITQLQTMIQTGLNLILSEYTYLQVYVLTVLYFCFLYFILGPLFLLTCKALEKRNWLHQIHVSETLSKHTLYEIKQSIQSILIFGFSGIPLVYGIRKGLITLLPDTLWTVLIGLVVLIVWNEIHFFIVHRIMHVPVLYRHIHHVHHRSKIPSVFSVFSFHGLEAFLLSTVEFTIALLIPFSALAIFLFPLVSILLNYAGHCNYRFGSGNSTAWHSFGTRHSLHHYRNNRHYGFASPLLDSLFSQKQNN